MEADSQSAPQPTVTANIKLASSLWELEARVNVPVGRTTVEKLLPALRGLANAVVGATVSALEQSGCRISCRAGCGACCRQLVPIAPSEARAVRAWVESQPEPRQTRIRDRFVEAELRFRAAGVFGELMDTTKIEPGKAVAFGLRYFSLGVPCPFLENESCSIYEERPLICREYLVTSPPENCARVESARIEGVVVPLKTSSALVHADRSVAGAGPPRWIPLAVALPWTDANPQAPPERTGPELLHTYFDHLTGKRTSEIANATGLLAPPPARPASDLSPGL